MRAQGIPFAKGHGTGNDFVILPNLDSDLEVGDQIVRVLCDRRRGIGADGVLVVTRTASNAEVADQAGVAPYFMDYRNADGSVAQMCGNGARVFVTHLIEEGLAGAGRFQIATRGGSRQVNVDRADGSIRITMGPAEFLERDDLWVAPTDAPGRPALGVLMPNPHAVTWVDDVADAGRLTDGPAVTPQDAFPDGVNIEFVQVIGREHLAMRVFERGVGETLSCGTGACAAAVATLHRAGSEPTGQVVRVDVPGGSVAVTWRADGEVELAGPAQIVARGTIDRRWWVEHA